MVAVKDLVVGTEYDVKSSRKGNFRMRVTSVNGEWIAGVITKGMANAMCEGNEREEGESVTVREGMATFTEVSAA